MTVRGESGRTDDFAPGAQIPADWHCDGIFSKRRYAFVDVTWRRCAQDRGGLLKRVLVSLLRVGFVRDVSACVITCPSRRQNDYTVPLYSVKMRATTEFPYRATSMCQGPNPPSHTKSIESVQGTAKAETHGEKYSLGPSNVTTRRVSLAFFNGHSQSIHTSRRSHFFVAQRPTLRLPYRAYFSRIWALEMQFFISHDRHKQQAGHRIAFLFAPATYTNEQADMTPRKRR